VDEELEDHPYFKAVEVIFLELRGAPLTLLAKELRRPWTFLSRQTHGWSKLTSAEVTDLGVVG
jgi:hypothetical protein